MEAAPKRRVTIGMPVYNGDRYIARAISTLLAQDFRDFELVISDNASTDRTLEICRSFARTDPRIRIVMRPQNVGAAANFQGLLADARTEYFMWAAADDEWSEDWLSSRLAAHGDGVVVTFGRLFTMDADGVLLREYPLAPLPRESVARKAALFWAPEWEGKANLIYGLYKTALIQDLALPENPSAADHVFNYIVAQRGVIVADQNGKYYKRQIPVAASEKLPFSLIGKVQTFLSVSPFGWKYYFDHVRLTKGLFATLVIACILPAKVLRQFFELLRMSLSAR